MALSNEGLMWMSIGIWAIFVFILIGLLVSKKSTTASTPSGSTVDMGNLESTS